MLGLALRNLRFLVLVLLLTLLSACSAVRLSYDNADWLLARMAASYVDLDRDQVRALKAELAQFHHWHRSEELPRYAELLDEAARRLEQGLSREDALWGVASVRARSHTLSQQAAEDMVPLLLTLNDDQLVELEQRFARENRKFYAAKLPKDPEAAVAVRAEWLCDRLVDWTGALTKSQRSRVEQLVRAFPEVPALRLASRRQRQAEFLRLLRQRDDHAARAQLVAFLSDPEASRTPRYKEVMAAWEAQFVDLLLDLDRSLTPRQRATAVERLRSYAAEFRGLSSASVAESGA